MDLSFKFEEKLLKVNELSVKMLKDLNTLKIIILKRIKGRLFKYSQR